MLQERIEGKWLDCFRRVFTLNGIGKGTRVAILSETQSRPVLVQLSDLVGEGLISLSNEDPVTQALREQFVKHEMSMSTSIETIYSSTMCTFAAHGLGVGIINPYMAAVFKDRLCIRAFRPRLPVTTYVAFTRFSPASELAQHFHSSIKAAYRSGW